MNQTREMIEATMREIAAHHAEVWAVRNAAERNNKWSEHHPDHIRHEIRRLQRLLSEAGV